jgi:hypothetical protein
MSNSLKKTFEIYIFAYAFLFASRPLSDPDFWWHLKTGQYILQTGNIPRTDFFSFTNFGKEWIAHEWLSEAIFYSVYSRLGFNSLIFIFAILTALAFWIAFRRFNVHPYIGGFATLLGVWTVLPTIGVRPRVFTLLFASIYLAILGRYARSGEGKTIWWLVLIMLLWVNLHGGFLIGLVLIGITIVGIPLDAWVQGKSLSSMRLRLRTLGLVLLGCLLAVLVNPQGARIFAFPFEIFFSTVQQQEVQDWLSPDFHDPAVLPLALLVIATTAAIALSPKRARPSDVLIFVTTLFATLKSNRHMAIFALVAVPLLTAHLQSWIEATPIGKSFGQDRAADTRRLAILPCVLLLLPLMAFASKLKSAVYSPPKQEVIDVPLKAVAYMKDHQISGNTFTDPNIWGGYLIWELPANPVFIDGRIDMYGDQFVKEYLAITRGFMDWREAFNRYDVRVAVVKTNSFLDRNIQKAPDWQVVYTDNFASVFERK